MNPLPPGCDSALPKIEQARWFVDEIHAHEGRLRAFVRSTFPMLPDVDDVVQESYLRVWKTRATQPIHSARAFLFLVARRVALNLLDRQRTSPLVAVSDLAGLPEANDTLDPAQAASRREKVQLLAESLARLPPRCREVMVLAKIERLSHREVARRLGLSERTVAEQVARGVKRCYAFLARQGVKEFTER